ncbi:TerC family protein [Campylobacter sp. RM12640]|uniref:TerC family protein n=1 Tax=unclassified Campylobacter TaxID=2593542 RepID=UPI001BD9A5E3|nr:MULTISPECIES: TerC family protein [unclassified Campylobacter]MBZ7975364.1 TerC family protein [Campylobacter sp. RM12637]MBZ7979094.1 TerC family protein [Campylobacter sp. RM12642]MBZ7981711.1 TerC family protein [Campylobacter sp. RM12640]MBZ7988590.1 TerC family protein [Campylobacter sp. RM12635]MBZ7993221.1 TerC family protein [Campylobacter sp. RM9333]MBZ8006784.1 TerC family protein [Campylobacter sp. RM9334]
MFEWIFTSEGILSFVTLVLLEIVLGIDNIIFLTILVSKLPKHLQNKGRILGLGFAMLTRIALLFSIFWLVKLTKPLFNILGQDFSGRDIVLIGGGIFLIIKSIKELISMQKNEHSDNSNFKASSNFFVVIIEIALIDIIFSLDSVITAVGIADELSIMILAVIIAMMFMMIASKWIGDLVEKFQELKTLALTFLVLVGGVLIVEGLNIHINKAYIYTALAFSIVNTTLNILQKKAKDEE